MTSSSPSLLPLSPLLVTRRPPLTKLPRPRLREHRPLPSPAPPLRRPAYKVHAQVFHPRPLGPWQRARLKSSNTAWHPGHSTPSSGTAHWSCAPTRTGVTTAFSSRGFAAGRRHEHVSRHRPACRFSHGAKGNAWSRRSSENVLKNTQVWISLCHIVPPKGLAPVSLPHPCRGSAAQPAGEHRTRLLCPCAWCRPRPSPGAGLLTRRRNTAAVSPSGAEHEKLTVCTATCTVKPSINAVISNTIILALARSFWNLTDYQAELR